MTSKNLPEDGRYQRAEEIARGGMSTIYRVFDTQLRRNIAMKVLDPEAQQNPKELQRFIEEAQITAQLGHPNIVPVYELGLDKSGRAFFTLKLIKGGTLLDLLHQKEYDPSAEADLYQFLQIFLKVCDALSFAHSHGVVHRDLKPENIMVGSHGQVYLMDWGLVRLVQPGGAEEGAPEASIEAAGNALTRDEEIDILRDLSTIDLDKPGEAMGSFLYLPPEQAHGHLDQIDERTDVFALGAILYEILAQKPIYFGWSHEELLAQAKACEIQPPQEVNPQIHLPPRLCQIAMKALQANPSHRYPSVVALKEALEFFLHGSGRLQKRSFPQGTEIIVEGELGDTAYLIIRGRCQVTKTIDGQSKVLRELGPSDVFGETAAFSSRRRTASVTAIDEVVVKVIDRLTLEQEFGFGSWINRVLRALAARFAELDQETVERNQQLTDAALLNQLLVQLHIHGQRIDESHIQTSWSQLADHLCPLLQCTKDALSDKILRFDAFSIHVEKDLLVCDPLRLQTQLHIA